MKKLNVSDETYEIIKGQLQEQEKIEINDLKDLVGKKLFIRTVTYHFVGKVQKIIGNFLQLSNTSWIADSGRFSDAIKDGFGDSAEIEPIGDWWVNINSFTDFGEWKHELPNNKQ